MQDVIKLLPDSIANQIAAGEVIQRPASVVKELVENAIDAGSTSIRIIIKDAGKTLIQVIDDGKGMTPTDARMAFERHATSKIRSAEDLFAIKTMGFRGEALASIAAIAQVEMLSRPHDSDIATRILIEGTAVQKQESAQSAPGTSIAVKNLFFNVPARRKFLKSDPVEFRHILDEFHRVALAHPEIAFHLFHNGNEIFHLPKSNLKQRIVNILGRQYTDKLLPVEEETELCVVSGFTFKVEASKKTPGDQYFFVNKRFIKSNYLNHAVRMAYDELIQKEQYPGYVIFLDMDPAQIDINVHPTKTEIKFEDERLIYNIVKVTVKHALGQFSVAGMLDFTLDSNLGQQKVYADAIPSAGKDLFSQQMWQQASRQQEKAQIQHWEQLYSSLQSQKASGPHVIESEVFRMDDEEGLLTTQKQQSGKEPFQLHQSYIIYQVKSGLMIMDQQAAHQRILYEQFVEKLETGEHATQKELFPRVIEMNAAKAEMLKSIIEEVNALGFEISDFGNNAFVIHGTPAGLHSSVSLDSMMDNLIDCYHRNIEFQLGIKENLARSMAESASIKKGQVLSTEEMQMLADQLFACKMPHVSPGGNKCFIVMEMAEIIKKFN